MKKKKIRINKELRGYQTGTIVEIDFIDKDIPKDKFWYDRLKDAKIDNCIEIVKDKEKKNVNK